MIENYDFVRRASLDIKISHNNAHYKTENWNTLMCLDAFKVSVITRLKNRAVQLSSKQIIW